MEKRDRIGTEIDDRSEISFRPIARNGTVHGTDCGNGRSRKHKKKRALESEEAGRTSARARRRRRNRRGEEGLVFHFFPRARRTKAIVEDPIVED